METATVPVQSWTAQYSKPFLTWFFHISPKWHIIFEKYDFLYYMGISFICLTRLELRLSFRINMTIFLLFYKLTKRKKVFNISL